MYQNCPICYEPLIDNIKTLICNHIFHDKCIKEWLQYKETCPYCRVSIPIIIKKSSIYRNIEIMEETDYHYYIKVLDRHYGIPISFKIINKSDIELITHQSGEDNIIKLIYLFIKNKEDIVDTIMDIIDNIR